MPKKNVHYKTLNINNNIIFKDHDIFTFKIINKQNPSFINSSFIDVIRYIIEQILDKHKSNTSYLNIKFIKFINK